MLPLLPDSGRFSIKDIALTGDSKVTMLGVDGDLAVQSNTGGIEVTLPKLNPTDLPCQHVFTLKITGVE